MFPSASEMLRCSPCGRVADRRGCAHSNQIWSQIEGSGNPTKFHKRFVFGHCLFVHFKMMNVQWVEKELRNIITTTKIIAATAVTTNTTTIITTSGTTH
jgi:hypothetical protein